MILLAVLKRKASKSAQYRFLHEHRSLLVAGLGLPRFPARSTYFERYRHAHALLAVALRAHAQRQIDRGRIEARCVAVDKTLLRSRGPLWHKSQRAKGQRPRGVDAESTWSYSKHHGWVQGYGLEVIVSAAGRGPIWPLLGSVDPANWREARTFPAKIGQLPRQVRYVLADSGYDSNAHGEAIEWDEHGRRTGRRLVCPQQRRRKARRPGQRVWRETRRRRLSRWRRGRRRRFYESRGGRALYRRRGQTVEPFFEWFKSLFGLDQAVWHRGLDNNRTQILAALLAYQILLRYNRIRGRDDGQIRWILDAL